MWPSRKAEAALRVVAAVAALLAQPVAAGKVAVVDVVAQLAQAARPVQRVPRAHPQAEAVVGAAAAGAEGRQQAGRSR